MQEMTMVERVARALSVADGMHPDAVSNDEDEVPAWTLYVKDARAAIEALREPTEKMIDSGQWQVDPVSLYQSFIDAAL